MSERVLAVWWDGAVAGRLTQDRHGDLSFAYDPHWLTQAHASLSRSLPLRAEPFDRRACRPFFGGLLPEEAQRAAAAGALGVSPANEFALLDRLGGDVAGALTLLPEGEVPPPAAPYRASVPLDDAAFAAILDRLPDRPMLAGEADGLRLSLAGAQAKLPVVIVDGRPALPLPGQPTTHIVKPEIARFPGSVANEAWCMALAARVRLDVAPAEAREAAGRPYLLVARYDRAVAGQMVTRLHQEDACQALGVPAERKYAAEGGPAFRDLFALTRDYARVPAIDVLKLVDAALFNLAIGNADAHGKNFSFLLDARGPRLAPLYDLLATIDWPALSPRLAMRVGRAGTIDDLDAPAWARFADDAGITLPFLRRRGIGLMQTIGAACGAIAGPPALAARTILRAQRITQSLAD
jgi:serine/threonine-protein kinase HipA